MERPASRADKTMPNMPAKITRLELVIIVAALVVLLFSNRPPQPGNAEIRTDTGLMAENMQDPLPQVQSEPSRSTVAPESGSFRPYSSTLESPDNSASDNMTPASIPQPKPRQKRYAMVDARKCDSLRYPNVMYGEITVTRVWNGTTFEWRKVCEVKEKDGTVSIWKFDDRHDGVIISELPSDPTATY